MTSQETCPELRRKNPAHGMFNWISTHPWAYPALEVVHLLGVGLLIGNLTLFELRVWGFGHALPPEPLARLSLALALLGFDFAAASGSLMLASQWADLSRNPALMMKLGLISVAGANAFVFHARGGVRKLDGVARAQTALSLGLWVLVVACGRFIAYV